MSRASRLRRAERRRMMRMIREGREVAVSDLVAESIAPKKAPYRAMMFGWNRHGAVKLYPVELHGENQAFRQKLADTVDLMGRMVGVADPTPYELGVFLGQNGGPLSPMDTGLAAIAGWAEMNGWKNLGEEVLGEEPVFRLATVLRDVLGGLFIGARSRGGESLVDEALDEMRRLPKAKRF